MPGKAHADLNCFEYRYCGADKEWRQGMIHNGYMQGREGIGNRRVVDPFHDNVAGY